MERMRSLYRSVSQGDRNPLHTHQNSRQFQDLMPETAKETQSRHNLLLARALGLVQQVDNQVTGFAEIKFTFRDPQTGFDRIEVLGATWPEAEDSLLTDQNRRVAEVLDGAIRQIGTQAATKPQKQALYQQLMAYLAEQERTLPGGQDSQAYRGIYAAIAEFVKVHGLFISDQAPAPVAIAPPAPAPVTAGQPSEENRQKYTKLVESCYRRGAPSATEQQLLDTFAKKYGISPDQAAAIAAQFTTRPPLDQAAEEYGLMFRAFLDNDQEIDIQEQAQLLELQEDLGLTNDQVATIEANVREELGLPGA
jgi:hypothetical protein